MHAELSTPRSDETLPLLDPRHAQRAEGASPLNGPLNGPLDVAGRSHVGHVRDRNEDHFVVAHLGRWMRVVETNVGASGRDLTGPQGTLLVVGDGMGGQGGGDVASAVALDSFVAHSLLDMPWLAARTPGGMALLQADVTSFLAQCQARLSEVAARKSLPLRLGTTLTAAYLSGSGLIVVHVGDSRCYRLREGALTCLTHDHTLGAALGDPEGKMGHVLLNAIGGTPEAPQPEIGAHTWQAGDRILVCSDGLHGVVDDAALAALLSGARSAREACEGAIAAALERGAPDNVTALVAIT